jgi:hypothetical protein
MMFSILFNTMDAALLTKAPEALSEQELTEMHEKYDEYELGEEITVVKTSSVTLAQRHSLIALQGLVAREKVAGEGEDAKDITYVVLTPAGAEFVPTEDAE